MPVRVIDTDVLSFVFRNDSRASLYVRHLFEQVLTISFQTRAEMLHGAISANWGTHRRLQLDRWLLQYTVVHSSDVLCLHWAEAIDSARRNGRPISPADAWIAATALHLGVPLITHNENDFLGVAGLTVISES